MPYDFESCHDRHRTRASKWVQMLQQNPEASPGVVPMTVADMDFATAPEIVEALVDYPTRELLGYSRPTDEYLNAVLTFYREQHGYQAQKEWVFTTPGVVPALAAAVRACAKPGEGVLVFTPIYGPFYEVIEGQGRQVVGCPLHIRDSRYHMDFDLLDRVCREERPKLLLFCSPHNPSGRVWTREELKQVADICEKHRVFICSDEIHSDIILGELPHTVFNTVSPWAEGCILCTSAGKTYNIESLQCANIFIKDRALYRRFELENLYNGIERANVLGMVATRAAYDKGGPWLRAVTQVIRRNHQLLLDFLRAYPGRFEALIPDAGFLTWVSYQGMGVDRSEFIPFLIDCQFYVTDGLPFGPGAERFIRVNVGLPTQALQDNLNRLAQGLKERYGLVPGKGAIWAVDREGQKQG